MLIVRAGDAGVGCFVMRRRKFWVPMIASLIVTPVALLMGIGSAGAGHGDYLLAIILFPYTLLSTLVFDSITPPFIYWRSFSSPFMELRIC